MNLSSSGDQIPIFACNAIFKLFTVWCLYGQEYSLLVHFQNFCNKNPSNGSDANVFML